MRIRILGAGIIGLSCADELVRRGHHVTLVDPAPGSGASHAAAGMLSPGGELWHGESSLFGLGLRSLDLWPAYAARLGVPLRTEGTLLVGRDHGDLQQVERQAALLAGHGVRAEMLTRREAVALEPELSARVAGAALLPDDHSVDPRAIVAALLERLTGLLLRAEAPADRIDATVVATGARLPVPHEGLVRGVRGEIVRAQVNCPPRHTIRGWVRGEPVYVVPRASGEIVIGATSEEHDEPPVPTVGGVARLLEAARELVPGLEWAEFREAIARDRPGTADNLPLIGPSGTDEVVIAAGHFRSGILLAPLTAQLVADHLEAGYVDPVLDPRRFACRSR